MSTKGHCMDSWRSVVAVFVFGLSAANVAAQCDPQEVQKLVASDGAVDDRFGNHVSIGGSVAIVGVEKHDDNGTDSGSAYVFRFNGVSWVEEQELLLSNGAADDRFGCSVAVRDDIAIVGSRRYEQVPSTINTGSAYLYRFNGISWVEEQRLMASDTVSGDEFGTSVSFDGDVLIIGAPGDDDNGSISGSAYVFRWSPDEAVFIEQQKLVAADGAGGETFGVSVMVDDDLVIVGADRDEDNGYLSGSAYVFRFDGVLWNQEQKLTASDGAPLDRFGRSVGIAGDVAIVSAHGDDDDGSSSGSAYIFRFDGSSWVQEQKLTASDAQPSASFGVSVSIDGDLALVGSSGNTNENGENAGAAYLFRFKGDSWIEEQQLLASDGTIGDYLGISVSIQGGAAIVSVPRDDSNGILFGSAYIFDLNCEGSCSEDLDDSGDIGVKDLLILLGTWGPCPKQGDCPADFDNTGDVGVKDLLILLGNWGPCP